MHNVMAAQVSLNSSKAWLRYKKTNSPNKLNKLNHKPQGVCEGNKKELEKKTTIYPLKYFAVEGANLEGCRRTVTRRNQAKLTTNIVYSIKVIVV